MTIECEGKPGERMPVSSVTGVEGPDDGLPGKTAVDVEVLGDVIGVVEIDEIEMGDWDVNQERAQSEDEANQDGAGAGGFGHSLGGYYKG